MPGHPKTAVNETDNSLIKSLLKSSSLYAFSGILRHSVSFIMLPIYTTYLSPKDYGIVSLMVFVISLIEITLGARMGHAPQKYYHDQKSAEKRKRVISTALFITFFCSLIVTTLSITQSDLIAELLYKDSSLSPVVALFLVLITTQAIEAIGMLFIRIQNKAMLFFWLSVGKLITQLVCNIVFIIILKMGVLGMATASAFSAVIFAGVILLYVIREAGFTLDRELGSKMLLLSVPLWLSGLVSLYIGSSNRYLMNIFVSLDDIGLYSLAERLSAIIGALLFTPFFNHWSAERFRLKDRSNFDDIQRNIFLGVSLILFAAGLGIVIYGKFIIGIMADQKFYTAYKALPYLISAYIFQSLASFYQFSFLLKEKTGLMSKIMNITAVATTIFNLALIPTYGFVGAAIAMLGSQAIIFLLSHRMAKPLYDMKLPISKVFISIFICAIGYIVSELLKCDPFTISGFASLSLIYITTIIVLLYFNVNRSLLIDLRTQIMAKWRPSGSHKS